MTRPSTCSLDAVRAEYPHLGLAVYAMEPGGPVTLEIYTADGQVFPFTGASTEACLLRAFPPDEPTEPDEPVAPAVEPPTLDIFD